MTLLKKNLKKNLTPAKTALLATALLLLLCAASILCLLPREDTPYIAHIYQNGTLIMSIPLDQVTQPRQFTLYGENGCSNTLEVRPGSIGILSADCPDWLCVRQGFISDTKLPITCLPNRLVIQLRPVSSAVEDTSLPDVITY